MHNSVDFAFDRWEVILDCKLPSDLFVSLSLNSNIAATTDARFLAVALSAGIDRLVIRSSVFPVIDEDRLLTFILSSHNEIAVVVVVAAAAVVVVDIVLDSCCWLGNCVNIPNEK